MLKQSTRKCVLCALLSLLVLVAMPFGQKGHVSAYSKVVYVETAEEFSAALKNTAADCIRITKSFDVPCDTATTGNGSYFTIERSLTIEGSDPKITIMRTQKEGAANGKLQSIFGIKGNGSYDGIQVSLFNLIFDGGVDYDGVTGIDRVSQNLKGVYGRSLIDVYNKATLNLETGVTIKNSACTYSLSSLNNTSDKDGSYNYGGAVRVDWDKESGGGTVNVKAGSCIKDCIASKKNYGTATGGGYGGAIGAYSFARLNVYGGVIENCYADKGGAVGCTRRAIHTADTAGTFNMYGGEIRNCAANHGGAISVYGTKDCVSNLLGGTIKNCTATQQGGSVSVEVDGKTIPTLNITPYADNGALQITGCGTNTYNSQYSSQLDGYTGLYLGTTNQNVVVDDDCITVTFLKYYNDTTPYARLTVPKGESLGESFPAPFPVDGLANKGFFIEWATVPDGSGNTVDENTVFNTNQTVYARWVSSPEYTLSDDLTITYGDEGKKVEVFDVHTPYGGNFSFNWELSVFIDGKWKRQSIPGATNSSYTIPVLDAGKYIYDVSITNASEIAGYSTVYDQISVIVEPKQLDITWSDTEFVYNGKNKLPKAVLNGVLDGDDVDVKVSGAKSEAGTYTATAVLTGDDAGNYVIAEGKDTCSFTISPVIKMPDLTGKNYQKAMTELEKFLKDNGLKATITYGWAHNSDPAKNLTVAQTTPASGEPVNDVDTIILMVYEGYNPTISLNKNAANVVCGDKLTLKATMSGASSAISWKSSDSKVATVDKNGKVTTKMAGTATITASALGVSAECKVTVLYKDVTNTSDFWYAPTNYLTAKGVVKGYANQTEFRPANDCTRAQMITFLYRLQGEPKTKSGECKFTDVKSKDYFYKPVIWAVEQGITTVPSDKKFNPQTVCTRAMTVTFLWRMAGKPEPGKNAKTFPDVKKTDYFYKATLWASEMKILAGLPDGTFQPQGKCLRRQMVTFLYKYDKYVNGKG